MKNDVDELLARGTELRVEHKLAMKPAVRAYLWALATIAAAFLLVEAWSFERLVQRIVPGSLCATHAVAIIDARAREAALARQAPQPRPPQAPNVAAPK